MNVDPSLDPKSHQKHTRMGVIRWLIREYLGTLFVGVILFWTAGTINWLMAWLLVGIYAAWVTASALLIIPKNPELLVERASRKKSSETWDNIIMAVFGVTTIVKFFLAGLDYRYSWTSQISEQIQILTVFVTVLGFYLEETQTGKVYGSRFVMRLSPKWNPEPDLFVITPGKFSKIKENYFEGPADVVIEILSKATRDLDLKEKLPEYLRAGVKEVWIVDPENKTLSIHSNSGSISWAGANLSQSEGAASLVCGL